MKVLLITPPMTQLNTPYPATAYLTGFLRSRGVACSQADFSIGLALKLFSPAFLTKLREHLKATPDAELTDSTRFFVDAADDYIRTVEPAIRFLQGKDSSLATRIARRQFLPEGPRFVNAVTSLQANEEFDALAVAFGELGIQDRARYFASLYIDDICDMIREGADPRFEISRYGEKLAASQPSFDLLERALKGDATLVDEALERLTLETVRREQPDAVGLTVPFPGNVYGAFRVAQVIRQTMPQIKLILGGGYVNTELRELKDARVFDYFDFITVDDGERPFLQILEGKPLLRTFVRGADGAVKFEAGEALHDIPQKEVGFPTYDGLPIRDYLSIIEMLNPMHRLWSDARWNKLTIAHGCYWRKCNFCDVTLDYIGRYEQSPAALTVDRMEALIRETGQTGFHFVDEAAPPAALRAIAQEILKRGLSVSWWGNVRFDKTFTPELCQLLADSGCIAMTGGLEVATNRLLQLMNKGVTVEQVANVTKAMTDAGIMVHAYLMYGFATQTEQETIDALEMVRQLFEAGCIQSAYWHRFSVTVHSPVGKKPDAFKVRLLPEPQVTFARNDLAFEDPAGCDHAAFAAGLKAALYNYMHGLALDTDVRAWFDFPVPKTTVPRRFVEKALTKR